VAGKTAGTGWQRDLSLFSDFYGFVTNPVEMRCWNFEKQAGNEMPTGKPRCGGRLGRLTGCVTQTGMIFCQCSTPT
jgi:hypothetical protein